MFSLLRRNGDFRRLLLAGCVSMLGDWFATVALLSLSLELTHSALMVSMVFVAQTVPPILLGPAVAGGFSDRHDRRRVIVLATSLQFIVAMSFLLIAPGRAWIILAGQAAITSLAAFTVPAISAATPNLVDRDDYVVAMTTTGSAWGAMLVIGAGVGGLFVIAFGTTAAFIANAATFLVGAVLIASIRRPMQSSGHRPPVSAHPLAALGTVRSFSRTNRLIPALILARCGVGVAMGAVGLLASLSAGAFNSNETGVGILLSARGVGAMLGPLMARHAVRTGIPTSLRACGLGAMVMGISYISVAMSPALWVAAVCVCLAHLGAATQFNASTSTIIMLTPDAIRGRVTSVADALGTITSTVSFLAGGFLSGVVGVRAAIACLGATAWLMGVAYLVGTRRLRHRSLGLVAQPLLEESVPSLLGT